MRENLPWRMIRKKLVKGWSVEQIHEYDEYPMELILEVQQELATEAKS